MSDARLGRRGLLLATPAIIAGAAIRPARAADEIVLGATVPITGPLAASGLQYYDALQLAEADINAAGGIHGRKIRIAFEDTQASNSVAVNAFVKLAQERNPPFMFLSSYTIQNLAVEPQVRKAEIPCAYAGGGVAIAKRGDPWMFRIRPPDNLAGEAMGATIATVMKAKKLGVLHVLDNYGTASANAAAAAAKAAGVSIAGVATYNARDNDFSAQLLSLKQKGADALLAISYVRDGALVLTQRRSLGVMLPMLGNTSFVEPALLALVTPADLSGLYAEVDAVLGSTVSSASASYIDRFRKRFGMTGSAFGSCYYDAAMMVADGLRAVGPDRSKLRDYFAHIKGYKGVTRTYTNTANGDMAHSVVVVDFEPGTKAYKPVRSFPAGAPV